MRELSEEQDFDKKVIFVANQLPEAQKTGVVAVSGGFDPVHAGHIDLFREARNLGEELVVILSSDKLLKEKRGQNFMSQNDRATILEALRFVDRVFIDTSDDNHAAKPLQSISPDIFANGSDKKGKEVIPDEEYEICEQYDISMVFDVGGEKKRSSLELLNNYCSNG